MVLSDCLTEAFTAALGGNENFEMPTMNSPGVRALAAFVVLVLKLLVVLIAGKWLWNNVLIKLFTVAKPATSVWQILGFVILLALIQ